LTVLKKFTTGKPSGEPLTKYVRWRDNDIPTSNGLIGDFTAFESISLHLI